MSKKNDKHSQLDKAPDCRNRVDLKVRRETVIDGKIRRLNKLAVKIDKWCNAIHPSAWAEHNKVAIEEYKRLAKEIGETIK